MSETTNGNSMLSNESAPSEFPSRIFKSVLKLSLSIFVVLVLVNSVIFVDETEVVIVERLGRIAAVYDLPQDRGLHFKLPWPVGAVRRFDRRVQLFDPPGREIFTSDKKNITVNIYVCWKIAEPAEGEVSSLIERPSVKFFRGFGNIETAEARINSRVHSILSTEMGKVELSHLLNVTDSEAGPDTGNDGQLKKISDNVRRQVVKRTGESESLRDRLGIEIVDVRIKRINLPVGNQQAVFERMKSERKKIADQYRSAGLADNKVIRSQADRQYNEILSKANAAAEKIRGDAEAESISILNRAHAKDPEFYKLILTLDTYKKILNERTTLVLSASNHIFKILTEGVPDVLEPSSEKKVSPSEKDHQPKVEKVTKAEKPIGSNPPQEEKPAKGESP